MRTDISQINEQTPCSGLTEGMQIFAGGTSRQFNTGEWRTNTPYEGKMQPVSSVLSGLPGRSYPLSGRQTIGF